MSLKKQWVGVLLSCALISCSKREQERDEQGLRTTLGEQGVHEKSKINRAPRTVEALKSELINREILGDKSNIF